MSKLIKVSDIRELIYEYEKEDITIGRIAEILEERFLERMSARGKESWGELESYDQKKGSKYHNQTGVQESLKYKNYE